MSTLLTYNLPSTKQLQMEMLCVTLGIHIRVVKPSEWHLPIKLLLQTPPHPITTPTEIGDEMLLLCQFTEEMIDNLLQLMKQNNISIPLKAVLTPTNSEWNSITLHQHLSEHAKN